jgi:hypothetical protein
MAQRQAKSHAQRPEVVLVLRLGEAVRTCGGKAGVPEQRFRSERAVCVFMGIVVVGVMDFERRRRDHPDISGYRICRSTPANSFRGF